MSKKINRENDTVEVVEATVKSEMALREEEIQAFWQRQNIFNKSLERPAGGESKGDYIFYDGPPFATGLPHYGHLLAGTIKDAIPRFWTMNGFRVKRRWGWDCHGLPLENLIEKKLGLANKKDIEEFGIKNFNEAARDAVLEYRDDWKEIVPRLGRFVDMENDYKTMDSTYTESVWWVFKQLHEKGLVYEGYKAMHLCPRCGTTLSNFEVNQGYADVKDIAVTVKMPILDREGNKTDTSILIWTTTPWTLPGNMAVAVHKDFEYVKVKVNADTGSELVIIAKGRLAQLGDLAYEVIEEIKGSDLVGLSYEPPFDYLQKQSIKDSETAWKIYHADYVELGEEGTGAVHIAPAYGEEDMNLAKEHNIPIVHHVDYEGRFMSFVTEFAGQLVKPKDDDVAGVTHLDADIKVLRHLQELGKIFKKENITHSYPHCWRDGTPLLNYGTTSWFVKVTDIKDELVAANNQVKWVPDHVGSNRFGKWLEGARDWAVSRQRYWGAPLPIWRSKTTGKIKVIGSLNELKNLIPKSGNTYFLMRHGESASNADGYTNSVMGDGNDLTEQGRKEVINSAETLKSQRIDRIICSPFARTKETAKLVAEILDLPTDKVQEDLRLREISVGDFEGKLNKDYQEFLQQSPEWNTVKPEGGESWLETKRRVGEFIYDIDSKYKNERILVISHNAPLRMLGAVAHGYDLNETAYNHDSDGYRYANAEVRELDFAALPHNDDFTLDFHRPYIDEVKLYDNDEEWERVPDVFDCWFESGSMPYAQHHYPFSCADTFTKECFPAQFIAEGLDQTRGWFYSMLVLGVALFGKSPYENVIVNGLVLAEDGKKMSKSLNNYPDPMELVSRVGADSIRYYLLSSPAVRGEDLSFSEKEILEQQRKNLGRLHNVLAMYELFADNSEEAWEPSRARHDANNILDQWIVARLNQLIIESTNGYKNYELDKATRPISDFIDDLSVWYLRRSRERLKGDDESDKKLALGTLRFVLRELAKVMAPVMPFYAEYLYQAVRSEAEAESVHLAKWPEGGKVNIDLIEEMQMTRNFVTLALEARTKANIKVRQPLQALFVKQELHHEASQYHDLIKDEVNVKEIKTNPSQEAEVVLDTKITPELKMEGEARELIRAIQDMRKAADLVPQDIIQLEIKTNSAGAEILSNSVMVEMIKKTVGASKIVLQENNGKEIIVGENYFFVSLNRM